MGVKKALSLMLYNELPYSPETTVISCYEITYTASVPFHDLFYDHHRFIWYLF